MKVPVSLIFDFDDDMSIGEWYDLTDKYRGTKDEYIRKDIVVKMFEEFAGNLGYLMTKQNVEAFVEMAINKAITEARNRKESE